MALDKATVKTIARLARVRVPDEELDGLAEELSHILDWVEQLSEVDTTDIPPMTSVANQAPAQRTDEIAADIRPDDVLANAPDPAGNFFTVPKVVE